MNPNKRSLIISVLVIVLMITNFTRLQGSECIRAIHIVTLVTLGAAIGVLLMNIILMVKSKKD